MLKRLSLVVMLSGCGRSLETIPVTHNVTYQNDIRPIIMLSCVSCHFSGPTDWRIYDNAFNKRFTILNRVVVDRSMPLGKYLSDKDRALFRDWVNEGGKP